MTGHSRTAMASVLCIKMPRESVNGPQEFRCKIGVNTQTAIRLTLPFVLPRGEEQATHTAPTSVGARECGTVSLSL